MPGFRIEIYDQDSGEHQGTEFIAPNDYVVLAIGTAHIAGTEILRDGDTHRVTVSGRGTERARMGLPERKPFNG